MKGEYIYIMGGYFRAKRLKLKSLKALSLQPSAFRLPSPLPPFVGAYMGARPIQDKLYEFNILTR